MIAAFESVGKVSIVSCFANSEVGELRIESSMIDTKLGIKKLKGESVIFAAKPDAFVKLAMVNAALTIVGIPLLPLVWLWAVIARDKFRYWLTNKRVILSSGFIGFNVRSIPLERISDVSLNRNIPEIIAGVSSLVVRDMTGEAEQGKSILAMSDVSGLQKQILEEVQRVNSQSVAL